MRRWLVLILILVVTEPAAAIIQARQRRLNTTEPTGPLANSGWQWQGVWGNVLGTPISRNTFITAEHVGGTVGDLFTFGGRRYKTVATYDDPNSDLQIWQIRGSFPTFAPLLTDFIEPGATAMIFGRGTLRGPEINVNGQLKGWQWGGASNATSWGMNIIEGSTSGRSDTEAGGASIRGARLFWDFDREGLPVEATVSAGDSGGGIFVQQNGKWKLAGVNFSVQSSFSFPASSDLLSGAILDYGGLKVGNNSVNEQSADIPSRGYASRITLSVPWIHDVLLGNISPSAGPVPTAVGVPEPTSVSMTCGAMLISLARRRRCSKFLSC
jgi:hypothetical protein